MQCSASHLKQQKSRSLGQRSQSQRRFDFFDIVKGTKGPLGKPEKEFATDIIETINPDKIIFIGDGHSDMLMAKNIEATPILVHHLDIELPYDYFCSTLFEAGIVLSWLLKANQ